MGLTLNAEQKSFIDLFANENHFWIPAYQRPYSWDTDQCLKLFQDLVKAFLSNSDYFLGSIFLSRNMESKYDYYVVDGQQRLISIWILLKIASLLIEDKGKLKSILFIQEWENNSFTPRITSSVFEEKDQEKIVWIAHLSLNDLRNLYTQCLNKHGELNYSKCSNIMEANALLYYDCLTYRKEKEENDQFRNFIRYIVEKIFVLPIELQTEGTDDAVAKSLTIFETINDRGINLENSDIFKEKLYTRSLASSNSNDFILKWTEMKNNCSSLNLKIDEIFRIYFHLINGENRVPENEQSLRDFFCFSNMSPLLVKSYNEVIDDLNLIINILQNLHVYKYRGSRITSWINILEMYTNKYPYYAIIAYLYKHPDYQQENLISLIKSVIRYSFKVGPSTYVKHEIFNIICAIMHNESIDNYYWPDISEEDFARTGRLRNAFALLAYYLANKSEAKFCCIDKILTNKDLDCLPYKTKEEKEFVRESLGNLIVIDLPKSFGTFHQRCEKYRYSSNIEVQNIFDCNKKITFDMIFQRDKKIKTLLISFFKGDCKNVY